MKSKKGKYLKRIALVLLELLILYIVIKVVIGVATNSPVNVFNHYVFVVKTESMQDFINPGDIVFIQKCQIDKAQIGDVISFTCINPTQTIYGSNIIHRVVDREVVDGLIRLTTKGDANVIIDEYQVTGTNFVGRVTLVSPFLGRVFNLFVSTYLSLYLIVLVLLLFVIVSVIKRMIKLVKEEHRQKEKEKIKEEILAEKRRGE